MDYYQIRDFLKQFFQERLDNMRERIALHGRMPELDRLSLENSHDFAKQELKEKSYHLTGTDEQLDTLIEDYDLDVSKPSEMYELLRVEFVKAFQGYCKKALEVDASFEDYSFDDEAKPVAVKGKKRGRTLGVAVADYVKEKQAVGEWDKKTAKAEGSKLDLLVRHLHKDRGLELPLEIAINIKEMLQRLPKNINKHSELEGKALKELAEMQGYKRLGTPTVNKYIQVYSGFYNWLVKRKEVSENNFKGLLMRVKKASKPRKGFGQDDIDRILEAATKSKKPAFKWGTLLAFYSGARLNEIAQLEVRDIAEVDGIWCIRITDEGDERKRLKTPSSKRDIPIHSKLVEMGFLDFVKTQRTRLFPALTYHPQNGFGRNLSRWFNESLLRKQLEIADKSLVFHSVRHTVATRLRNAKVDERTLKDIMGHAHSDVTSNYIHGRDIEAMQSGIETLDYGAVVALPESTEEVDPLTLP